MYWRITKLIKELSFRLKRNTITIPDISQSIRHIYLNDEELPYTRYQKRIEINLNQNSYFIDQEISLFDRENQLIEFNYIKQIDADIWKENVIVLSGENNRLVCSRIPQEVLDETKYNDVFKSANFLNKIKEVALPTDIDFKQDIQQINAVINVKNNELITIELAQSFLTAGLVVKKRKSANFYIVDAENQRLEVRNQFVFNINEFLQDELENHSNGRWDLFLLVTNDNSNWELKKVFLSGDLPDNKQERYLYLFKQTNPSTFNYKSFQLYLTNNRNFALAKNTVGNLVKEKYQIAPIIEKYQHKNNEFVLTISTGNMNKDISDIKTVIIQRNPDEFNEHVLDGQLVFTDNKLKIRASAQLANLNLIPLYWDIYLKVKIDNIDFYLRVANTEKNVKYQVAQQPIRQQIKVNNNIFYPYLTKNNSLSFVFRQREDFENSKNYFIEHLAYWYVKLFGKHLQKRKIWIGYEKMAQSAHDSGYHFFNYVYQNKLKKDYYYIIDKNSPEYHFLADKSDRILQYMSFKYFVYLFAADTLISSDTRRNAYNLLQRQTPMGQIIAEKKLVYLQHGVNGIKRVKDFYKSAGQFDLVIAPSEWEKEHLAIDEWGFSNDEVAATGLPRWDVMQNRQNEIPFKQIFVMPTWRNWMAGMPDELFKQSEFYQEYQSFLNNPQLKQILKENNVRIAFFMHPKFKDYIHLFDIDNSIIDAYEFLEVPMDEMIMKSSLMISDYSSVLWEMFYLKKPTIFYQFDQEKYLEYEGSSLDFSSDLFGDVTFSSERTIDKITEYINNDFEEKAEFAKMRSKYFNLMDQNNSKRVYQAILDHPKLIHSATKLGVHPIKAIILFIKRKIPYAQKLWRKLF